MGLNPGKEMKISSYVFHSAGSLDISELIKRPLAELMRRESDSVEKEKAIYQKALDVEAEWTEQARETVRIRQALEYQKILPVSHTENKWREDQYGRHEISNMVYVFSWRVYERTKYDRIRKESVPVAWELTWSLYFNTPRNPDNQRTGRQFAGQDRKVFKDKASMEKYLQGRIKAYAHLFTEISPPIPKGQEGRFSVNGVLLPGYTVEVPQPTPQEVADNLLDFLDSETDFPQPETPENAPPVEKPAPAHKPRTKKHGKSIPTR